MLSTVVIHHAHHRWSFSHVVYVVGIVGAVAALLDFFGVRGLMIKLAKMLRPQFSFSPYVAQVSQGLLGAAILLIAFTVHASTHRTIALVGLMVLALAVGIARLEPQRSGEQQVPWPDQPIQIRRATWKSRSQEIDVTNIVKGQLLNGRLECVADVQTYGEPEYGTRKDLVIRYRQGRNTFTATFGENEVVKLPPQ